jgi:hypothetical protein
MFKTLRIILDFLKGKGLLLIVMSISGGITSRFNFQSLSPYEFVDWLNTLKRVIDYYEVFEERKVKLVLIRFKGKASAWCQQFLPLIICKLCTRICTILSRLLVLRSTPKHSINL